MSLVRFKTEAGPSNYIQLQPAWELNMGDAYITTSSTGYISGKFVKSGMLH